jgi:branched-chain amino acid transport system substrate-binding protein
MDEFADVCSTGRARRSLVLAGVAAIGCSLALAACGGGDTGDSTGGTGSTGDSASGGDSGKSVVFAANTEISGDLQIYGTPAALGLKLGADSINKAGGIKVGDTTYQAEAYIADNRSDPSAVVSAARDVLDHNAIAALAPDLGDVPTYKIWKDKTITWTGNFALQALLASKPQDNPLLYSATPFLSELYVQNMKHVKGVFPNIAKVAILSPNNEEGKAALASNKAATEQAGMEVVDGELYPPGTDDFSSQLTAIKGKQPDLIIALQSPEQALAILQQAAQLGVAKYGLNNTILPERIMDSTQLKDMTVIIPNFGPTWSNAAPIPDYKPKEIFGDEKIGDSNGGTIVMWYAWHLLAQAITDAGTADDPSAVAAKLVGQSYDGPFGTCRITDRQLMDCGTSIFTVSDGVIEVDRFDGAEATTPSQTYKCRERVCTEAK